MLLYQSTSHNVHPISHQNVPTVSNGCPCPLLWRHCWAPSAHVKKGWKLENAVAAGEVDTLWAGPLMKCWFNLK